jgi:hypothetical protein
MTFYHAAGDPHSALLLQVLPTLLERFDVQVKIVVIDHQADGAGHSANFEMQSSWGFDDAALAAETHTTAELPLSVSSQARYPDIGR